MDRSVTIILLIVTILSLNLSYGQTEKVDSLISVLQNDINDSSKASTLIELSRLGRFTRQDSTLIWSEMAKEIAINIGDKQLEGLAIYTASYTYELQAKYKLAMEKCFEALKIFDEINYSKGIGRVYNYIAIIHFRQKQYIQALEFYQKSLEAKLLDPDTISIGWTYNNIGATYEHLEDYEQALKYYNLALDIAKTFHSRILNAASYGNIGIIYQKTGLLNESLESHLQSLKVFKEIDNKQYIAEAYQHIASIYLEQNKLNESEQYLINGLQLSQEINDRHGQAKFYETLIQLNEQNGDYLKALSYYKLLIVVKDSLFNISNSKQMAELQTKYESDQKQKENELLKKSVESKNMIILFTAIVIVLLLILSFLLFLFYRSKKRSHNTLQDLNQQVMEQKEELISQSEDLRRANNETRSVNDNLEKAVESRAKEMKIQNEKLIQYAYSNAHKVRGPLARILGILSIMKVQGENNNDLLLNIDQLYDSAQELDGIIKELNKILEEEK